MIEIKQSTHDWVTNVPAILTVVWIAMLSVGALGHFYNNEFLMHVNYWNLFLARMVIRGVAGGLPVTSWTVKGTETLKGTFTKAKNKEVE